MPNDFEQRLEWGTRNPDTDSRLAELILYISAKMEGRPNFGSTLLNKILWRADFDSYVQTGNSVTGAEYFCLPFGPAPRHLVPVRNTLTEGAEPRLSVQRLTYSTGTQERPVALADAQLDSFTGEQIAFVDKAIEMLGGFDAEEVSELSHGRAWEIAGTQKESLPYQAAFISDEPLTAYDRKRTQELAEELGW
jgi:hypothetical protein